MEHFDAIVVGSGFGGSVTAYRLAQEGLQVCVLERGRRYPPGSFPRSPRAMRDNFWDPSCGSYGLFNVWSFRGIEAVVASGLGGGSLIYANVLIRKDPRWFVQQMPLPGGGHEHWPITYKELERHYENVEKILAPTPYPFDHQPYNRTPKTKAWLDAAETLGLDVKLPGLAVTFSPADGQAPMPGEPIVGSKSNLHGRTRHTCRLCGECDIGCNYGSKNTLDYNFLSLANPANTEIREHCEVKSIWASGNPRFTVCYTKHNPKHDGQEGRREPQSTVELTCDRLILSAGTLGTSFLMLRNRHRLGLGDPNKCPALGTRFCGNGDLLGFMADATRRENGHVKPRPLDPAFGPVITSRIRIPDEMDGGEGRGYYIEEGGLPGFANWLVEGTDAPGLFKRGLRFVKQLAVSRLSRDPRSNLGHELANFLGNRDRHWTSLPTLGMGRDIPDGQMHLRGGWLEIDWSTKTSAEYFAAIRQRMQDIGSVLGGRFVDTPLHYLNRVVTVHPLGGCPMGRNEQEGVVNSHGEVFNVPGLYIADGSVMPGPVGPNPALTIAAMADRVADRIIENHTKGRA